MVILGDPAAQAILAHLDPQGPQFQEQKENKGTLVLLEAQALMDPQEIQALKDPLVEEEDLETQDQEVILVLLDIKAPLVKGEILDTGEARPVHLG